MSLHPQPRTAPQRDQTKPRVVIELDRPAPKHIVLSWRVSRSAVAQLAPAGPSQVIHLELRVVANQPTQCMLIDPKTNAERVVDLPADLSDAQAPIAITQTAIGLHLESPTLHAHLQSIDADTYELVYIRTNIFAQLNIQGGRYEPIGVLAK